jgi:hypothetical protein
MLQGQNLKTKHSNVVWIPWYPAMLSLSHQCEQNSNPTHWVLPLEVYNHIIFLATQVEARKV